MAPEDDRVTLAVVVSRLDDLREDLRELRDELSQQRGQTVARTEWEMRNAHVDSKFAGHGREIGQLRADLAARRQPWTSVASALVAVAALLVTLMERIG